MPNNKDDINWPGELPQDFLNSAKESHENGNDEALLSALSFCLEKNILPPTWVKTSFLESFNNWRNYQFKTLDESFGVQRKNIQLPAHRNRIKYAMDVYITMQRFIEEDGANVSEAIYRTKETLSLPFEETKIKDYYYEIRDLLNNLPEI